MLTISDDERLKAACHGLFLGCLLPVLAYNVLAKRRLNTLIYSALLAFEVAQIVQHLEDA